MFTSFFLPFQLNNFQVWQELADLVPQVAQVRNQRTSPRRTCACLFLRASQPNRRKYGYAFVSWPKQFRPASYFHEVHWNQCNRQTTAVEEKELCLLRSTIQEQRIFPFSSDLQSLTTSVRTTSIMMCKPVAKQKCRRTSPRQKMLSQKSAIRPFRRRTSIASFQCSQSVLEWYRLLLLEGTHSTRSLGK